MPRNTGFSGTKKQRQNVSRSLVPRGNVPDSEDVQAPDEVQGQPVTLQRSSRKRRPPDRYSPSKSPERKTLQSGATSGSRLGVPADGRVAAGGHVAAGGRVAAGEHGAAGGHSAAGGRGRAGEHGAAGGGGPAGGSGAAGGHGAAGERGAAADHGADEPAGHSDSGSEAHFSDMSGDSLRDKSLAYEPSSGSLSSSLSSLSLDHSSQSSSLVGTSQSSAPKQSDLTERERKSIRHRIRMGESKTDIAKSMLVSRQTVYNSIDKRGPNKRTGRQKSDFRTEVVTQI